MIIADCASKAIGVDNSIKTIPDAQMSSHYASGDHPASDGRLNSPRGWSGINANSWLQVGKFKLLMDTWFKWMKFFSCSKIDILLIIFKS